MKLKISLVLIPILIGLLCSSAPQKKLKEASSVAEVLMLLGDGSLVSHAPNYSVGNVSPEVGRDLVLRGITTTPKGDKTDKQSKHFVCTSCHNTEREDPDLSVVDPQARLEYARDHGLPFLQGTTLYGVVNRTSFYNGDYDKKYGDLVKPARNDIREAIQLCATECAQGRKLEPWEMESVIAYLWTLELELKDLKLTEEELTDLNTLLKDKEHSQEAVALLKSNYLQAAPATFVAPPENRKKGYVTEGNRENGKLIYDLSCMHCHAEQRYSFFNLDKSELTFEFLEKHIPRYSRYSMYQVGRYGTSPTAGKKAYMPQYTLEKMSNQQMEDLRAYIEDGAE